MWPVSGPTSFLCGAARLRWANSDVRAFVSPVSGLLPVATYFLCGLPGRAGLILTSELFTLADLRAILFIFVEISSSRFLFIFM